MNLNLLDEYLVYDGDTDTFLNEVADTKDIKVTHPGILDLPEGGFSDWTVGKLVSHMVSLAKSKGRAEISRALQNLIRWNKDSNPTLSSKAQSVFDKYSAELDKSSKKDSIESKETLLVKKKF